MGHFLRKCACGGKVRISGKNTVATCDDCGASVELQSNRLSPGSRLDQEQKGPITISPVGED